MVGFFSTKKEAHSAKRASMVTYAILLHIHYISSGAKMQRHRLNDANFK